MLSETSLQSENLKPVVSVLMPIYNCEQYLKETLDSLLRQTFSSFEVLLVNDGSTDSSLEILEKYATQDSRFKIINQHNQGIVAALNNGLAHAQGQYIARLDGDDIAHPERLSIQVEYLKTHLECICVGSLYRVIDQNNKLIGFQNKGGPFKQTNLDQFPPHVATLPHPSIMLRRADLVAEKGYRTFFHHAEDYDLFLRLSRKGTLDIIPLHLLDYRVHSGSLSAQNLQKQLDSAFKALLAAMYVHAGKADPFNQEIDLTIAQLIESFDPKMQRLFENYRRLRVIGGWLNRGQRSQACHACYVFFKLALLDLPKLFKDKRYWGVVKAGVKDKLKIILNRV